MIVHQHEAAEFRAEMAVDPRRQGGQDRLAIRRDPALAQIACRTGRNHQVLHEKGLVALEARSLQYGRRLDHLVLDDDPGRHLAAQPPLRLVRRLHRLRRFVHAARFDGRAALQSFQTRDLCALLADNLLQGGHFAAQFNQQRFKLWTAQIREGRWQWHVLTDRASSSRGKRKMQHHPGFCSYYARLIQELRSQFKGLRPTGSLLNLPLYAWKSIFTTNY